jgi:hypothetical protein
MRTGKNPTPRYWCTWGHRGGACGSKRKSALAAWVDDGIGAAVSSLVLPENWREQVEALIPANDQRFAYVAQRAALERKLARLKTLFIEGDLSQQDYRAERARVEDELARVQPPAEDIDRERAAALLADLAQVWTRATDDDRRELAAQAFDAVYLDLEHPEAGLHCVLKEALRPLAGALGGGCRRVTDGHRSRKWYIRRAEDRFSQAA